MSICLSDLKNKKPKNGFRVGRGIGSKGKTSGRGHKGAGSRSGYKRRHTYEGGQFRLFQKLPVRGFSRARFRKEYHTINLDLIEKMYEEGETVSIETLRQRGYLNGPVLGLKILGKGELKKQVVIEANAFSKSAMEKLNQNKIKTTTV